LTVNEKRPWLAEFLLLWFGTFLFWVAVFGQNATLPLHFAARGFLPQVIGWLLGTAGLASLGGRLIAGWSVQRLSTRSLMLIGGLLWLAATPPLFLTRAEAWLLLSRVAQGLALALFTSGSAGHVALATPAEVRGSTMAWWGLANSVAGAAAPAAAVFLAGAVSFPFALMAGALTAALAGLVGMIGPRHPRPAAPANPLGISRPALLPGALGGTVGCATGAYLAFGPLMAQQLGMANPGLILSLFAVGTAASRMVAGPLSDRWGRGVAIWPGLCLVALAMLGQGLVRTPYPAMAIPLLFGLGAGAAVPALMAWAIDRTAPQERAVAPTTFYGFYEGGMFLGPSVVGGLLDRPLAAFGLCALLPALAAAAYLLAAPRRPGALSTTP
jgi:MFS family permease